MMFEFGKETNLTSVLNLLTYLLLDDNSDEVIVYLYGCRTQCMWRSAWYIIQVIATTCHVQQFSKFDQMLS